MRRQIENSISHTVQFYYVVIGGIDMTVPTYPKNRECSLTILGDKGTVRIGCFALNRIEH